MNKREELIAQQQEIARQLAELDSLERAEKEKLELEKPITATVNGLIRQQEVSVSLSDFRNDIVEILRTTPGRYYDGYRKINTIPLDSWLALVEKLSTRANFVLTYADGSQEEVEKALKAPRYLVTLLDSKLIVRVKPGTNASIIYNVTSSHYNEKSMCYEIQLNEGWRLWDALKNEENSEWTDEAKNAVLAEIEKRESLDTIAVSEDADYNPGFINPELKLRPFQKVTGKFLEAANGRAIVAHQMGLGKTWCDLAYAWKNKYKTVVICPSSLKINWAREIKRLTGEVPFTFRGTDPSPQDIKRLLFNDDYRFAIFNYDILARKKEVSREVTDDSGNKYKAGMKERWFWIELINGAGFDLALVDEAHYIKNTGSQRSQAVRQLTVPRIIFTTGTPVLNRPGELWPMLTMLRPDQFPSEDTFINRYTYDGRSARNVEELRQLLKPLMIRKLKKDVVKELPPIERIYETVELSEKAQKMYNKALSYIYVTLADWNPDEAGAEKEIPHLLAQIMRLKQICAIDKMDYIADKATEAYDTHENGGASKVIIFSQFKPVAKGIARRLGAEALCMTGDLNDGERQDIVDRFQTDSSIHFLTATWQVAGEGRNLTAAGYVIFADLFWTPANHAQCEERCYGRLGDMHGATSYYITARQRNDDETVEDWIKELLAVKIATINEVVEGVEKDRNASIVGSLLKKMKEEMYKARGK